MGRKELALPGFLFLLNGIVGVAVCLLYVDSFIGGAGGIVFVPAFFMLAGARFLWQFFKTPPGK